MLSLKHITILQSIGLYIEADKLRLYNQENAHELLYEIPFSNIKGIKVSKTRSKRYSKRAVGLSFLWHLLAEPVHGATVYQLTLTLLTGEVKYSYLADFDLITATYAIKELNLRIRIRNEA